MGLNAEYAERLRDLVSKSGEMPDAQLLSKALVMCAVWRSKLWANTLLTGGTHIRSGPFVGMNYAVRSAEGALLPRLLGVYERELHPSLAAFAEAGLDHIVDIGCAEGYYAVGLARLMPTVRVHAYDTDPVAQRRCRLLAAMNGVGDRIVVEGEFDGASFDAFRDSRTLIFIDAEGFEDDILRPDLYPALAGLNVIVETHPMYRPGVTERLMERFAATHDIERIEPSVTGCDIDEDLARTSHLDLLLGVWEWRAGPTPWLIMRPRNHHT